MKLRPSGVKGTRPLPTSLLTQESSATLLLAGGLHLHSSNSARMLSRGARLHLLKREPEREAIHQQETSVVFRESGSADRNDFRSSSSGWDGAAGAVRCAPAFLARLPPCNTSRHRKPAAPEAAATVSACRLFPLRPPPITKMEKRFHGWTSASRSALGTTLQSSSSPSKAGGAAAGHFQIRTLCAAAPIREGTDCRADDAGVRDHEETVKRLRIDFQQRGHHAGLELVETIRRPVEQRLRSGPSTPRAHGDHRFGSRPKSDFPTRRNSPPARSHQAPGKCPAGLRLRPPTFGSDANRWIKSGPASCARRLPQCALIAARPSAERATSVCPMHRSPLGAVAGWRKRRSNIALNVR